MSLAPIAGAASQIAKQSFLKDLSRNFLNNVGSTAVTGLLSAPYFYQAYGPVGGTGALLADVVGSAGVSSLVHSGVNKFRNSVRPAKTETVINPEYSNAALKLGLSPGVSKDQILAASRQQARDASLKYRDTLKTRGPKRDEAIADLRSIAAARNQMLNTSPSQMFSVVPKDSALASPLAMASDIGYSVGVLPLALTQLENQGILSNNFASQPGAPSQSASPLETTQSDIVSQQLQSRSDLGSPNQALLSPGTHYQISTSEMLPAQSYSEVLMQDMLRQTFEQRDSVYNLDYGMI
jgi:hypothetical protein